MKPTKEIPLAELKELRKTKSIAWCAEHYGVSKSTIEKRLKPEVLKDAPRLNVDDVTTKLKHFEIDQVVPIVIEIISSRTKDNPIKGHRLADAIQQRLQVNMSAAKIRKYCNFIRSTSMLPVLSSNNGYYVSYDKEIIKSQVDRLNKRANLIEVAASGLKTFLR